MCFTQHKAESKQLRAKQMNKQYVPPLRCNSFKYLWNKFSKEDLALDPFLST